MPKITQKFASESPKVEPPTLPESDLNKLAAKNNEKKRVVIVRKASHDRIFTGC